MLSRCQPFAVLRAIGALVLLVPFLALSLIGPGVMPLATGQGVTLVLCTAEGAVTLTIDPATGKPAPSPKAERCDWAASQVALAQAAAGAAMPPLSLRPAEPVQEAFTYAPAHDPRGLFARGPPILS